MARAIKYFQDIFVTFIAQDYYFLVILCHTFQLLHLKRRFNAGQYAIGGLRIITRVIYICLDGTRGRALQLHGFFLQNATIFLEHSVFYARHTAIEEYFIVYIILYVRRLFA